MTLRAMTLSRLLPWLAAAFALATAGASLAQTTATPPTTPQAPKRMAETGVPQTVALLFAIHARSATLQGKTLVLTGVAPNIVVFADRPIRAAGHARTSKLVDAWKSGDEIGFDKTPPNATISVLDTGKAELATVVVALKAPRLEGDRLTFEVDRLDGDLAGANGPASVFIETVNVPLARLTARSGSWYVGSQ
jgi:hypothetical protein